MKVNVSMDDRLAKRMDDYADANYMTRSGLITVALTQYLNTQDMIDTIKKMGITLSKMANKNSVSESDKEEMEGYANLLQKLASSSALN